MKLIKRLLREPLFCLLPLLVLAWFWVIPAKFNISNIEFTVDGNSYPESIPLLTHKIAEHSNFSISFNIDVKNNKNSVYKFFPDDCILGVKINGKAFPQEMIKNPCDYSNGIILDLSEYVQKGLNRIELQMRNNGGPGGLRIENPYGGFKLLSLKHYIFTLLLLLSIALILRKFNFGFIAISIILLGIIVRLVIYTYLGPMQSPHDIEAHLQYMQMIIDEKHVPKTNDCWECHQPPPYYIASAVVKSIVDSYDPTLTGRILQQMQLLFSFGCVIFGVALILNLFGNNRFAYLASLISVFWTGFALTGPRINNDIEFYFGALFCMLFAQRYWLTHKNSDMFLATLGASIALASKFTGFVILAVWIVIYVLSVVRSLKIGSLRTLIASIFTVLLFIGISNHRTIVDFFEGKKFGLVGETANSLNGALRVNNTFGNYLYFDLKDYLLVPYASAWIDEGGRQYFWNYALKSSLHLPHKIEIPDSPALRTLATALCTFALLIFVLALWGIINAKFRELPAVLFTICLFASLIYFRINYPFSCNNEFRYIFPVLFPIAYFSVRGAHILENSRLKILAYTSMLIFAMLSFLFIVIPAF
ncbi:MAG: glycosyltransferase family 39 protein [Fibromonadales bacterium]|nr:glycosyltransferase family 39 protein [Fibromonadales bacterium]